MEAISKMNIGQSAKKVRLVLDEVRNTKVNEALTKLSFANKKSAKYIHQTISSALANLQQSDTNFDADDLYIKKAFINQGPSMKRFRPRAKGRASSIVKPFSKLTIVLEERKNSKSEKGKK